MMSSATSAWSRTVVAQAFAMPCVLHDANRRSARTYGVANGVPSAGALRASAIAARDGPAVARYAPVRRREVDQRHDGLGSRAGAPSFSLIWIVLIGAVRSVPMFAWVTSHSWSTGRILASASCELPLAVRVDTTAPASVTKNRCGTYLAGN